MRITVTEAAHLASELITPAASRFDAIGYEAVEALRDITKALAGERTPSNGWLF